VSYGLTVSSLAAATEAPASIHGPYSMATDKCGICHRSHAAKAPNLLTQPNQQSTLCFTCHDGLGASTNVKEQFTDPLVPDNDDAKRLYYRHDTVSTTATNAHISAGANEFGGVNNRHSECGDCHNPHQANGTNSSTTPAPSTGVTASGRLTGVSGVSVANGAAGTAPTYTFLDGKSPETSITREYQLCFKCHSSFTTLSSNGSFGPSRYRLDKAAEFNPNNPSYHPIEAAGKNTTPAMTASLAGGSIWKLTVNSTIRCVNCHASSTKYNLVTPPSATGDLPMHTSRNPGILLANYRNRVLMGPDEAYSSGNFALCYMCHSKTPFDSSDDSATNFSEHELHVSKLDDGDGGSASTDIDTPGAGRGNALCAECHFRQHSTTFAIPGQTIPGSRLLSFSPNVGGARTWTKGATRGGSCTLTCHGENHNETDKYNYE
jgi:predicted CXXCH cytochrome family protein